MVEGVLTHEMKRFIIDANKSVLNRPSPEAKVGASMEGRCCCRCRPVMLMHDAALGLSGLALDPLAWLHSPRKVEDHEFEEGEVYAIDIVVSTGEGKAKVRWCRGAAAEELAAPAAAGTVGSSSASVPITRTATSSASRTYDATSSAARIAHAG